MRVRFEGHAGYAEIFRVETRKISRYSMLGNKKMISIDTQLIAVNDYLNRIDKNRKYDDPDDVPFDIRVTNHELGEWHENTENLLKSKFGSESLDRWNKANETWRHQTLAGGGSGYDSEYDSVAYRLTLLRGVLLSLKNESSTVQNDNSIRTIPEAPEQSSSEKSRTSRLIEKAKGHPIVTLLAAIGGVIAFVATLIEGITYLANLFGG